MLIFGQLIGHLAAPAIDPFTSCRNLNFCSSNWSRGSIVKWVMCMSLPPYQFRTREVIGSASALGHGSACNASAGKTLWNGCKLGGGWPTASDLVNYTASLQIIENQKFITCMSLPSTSWYSPSSMPGISSCFLQEGQVGENALTNHLRYNFDGKQWPQGSRFTDPCEAMSSKHTGQASATPSICGASWSIASTFATRTLSSSDLRCDGAGCGAHDSNEERFPSSKFGRSGAHPTCPGCCCGHSHSEWAYQWTTGSSDFWFHLPTGVPFRLMLAITKSSCLLRARSEYPRLPGLRGSASPGRYPTGACVGRRKSFRSNSWRERSTQSARQKGGELFEKKLKKGQHEQPPMSPLCHEGYWWVENKFSIKTPWKTLENHRSCAHVEIITKQQSRQKLKPLQLIL